MDAGEEAAVLSQCAQEVVADQMRHGFQCLALTLDVVRLLGPSFADMRKASHISLRDLILQTKSQGYWVGAQSDVAPLQSLLWRKTTSTRSAGMGN